MMLAYALEGLGPGPNKMARRNGMAQRALEKSLIQQAEQTRIIGGDIAARMMMTGGEINLNRGELKNGVEVVVHHPAGAMETPLAEDKKVALVVTENFYPGA
ncbi:uncharacterized protein LOC113368149 [Ctenocephalides felis]|uniref:uncharacterized protein LOC113368149 n=1 Tax=Ctenocephalides felis TaxID=7515 RepID=UPI000E6E1E92|nr:uncharacterized protein LOC113368149 [Ctenocephalides felis]